MTAAGLPPLTIQFVGMWPWFEPDDNVFLRLLSQRFSVTTSDDPDLLIHSWWGRSYREYRCTRLLFSFENIGWGFTHSDFAITSDFREHERHYRYPYWAMRLGADFVQPDIDARAVLSNKEGFASQVVSNPQGRVRHRFYELLTGYRDVASGGQLNNNVGGRVDDKQGFITRYKFNLCFENSRYPGYTTEKLVDALRADTVPIYWGHPSVATEFNTRRFLNAHEFESPQALLDRVIELDQDDDAYCAMLAEPWFPDGQVPECADTDRLGDFLERAATWDGTPVGQRPIGRVGGTRLERKLRTIPRRRWRSSWR